MPPEHRVRWGARGRAALAADGRRPRARALSVALKRRGFRQGRTAVPESLAAGEEGRPGLGRPRARPLGFCAPEHLVSEQRLLGGAGPAWHPCPVAAGTVAAPLVEKEGDPGGGTVVSLPGSPKGPVRTRGGSPTARGGAGAAPPAASSAGASSARGAETHPDEDAAGCTAGGGSGSCPHLGGAPSRGREQSAGRTGGGGGHRGASPAPAWPPGASQRRVAGKAWSGKRRGPGRS